MAVVLPGTTLFSTTYNWLGRTYYTAEKLTLKEIPDSDLSNFASEEFILACPNEFASVLFAI